MYLNTAIPYHALSPVAQLMPKSTRIEPCHPINRVRGKTNSTYLLTIGKVTQIWDVNTADIHALLVYLETH
jgi:hypothetical protein